MGAAATRELFLLVSWRTDAAPGLDWSLASTPSGKGRSPLQEMCERAVAAGERGDVEAAVAGFDQALRAFETLSNPQPSDWFHWWGALWGKGTSLWNLAVGDGTYAQASKEARDAAWAPIHRLMGPEGAAVPKSLPVVLTWVDTAVTMGTRSGHCAEVAAIGQFLTELLPALRKRPDLQERLHDLFMDLIAAAWHVLIDVGHDFDRAVALARDLQSRCESGGPLLPVRELLFEALSRRGDFAQARQVADEVVWWLQDHPADAETTSRWRDHAVEAGARAGDPYDRAQLGEQPPEDEPVDRVVGLRGRSALMGAIKGGHVGLVKRLLDRGADVDFRDPGGVTPFLLAASQGSEEMIRLVAERGADVNAQTDTGDSALHLVFDRADMVRLLLDLGADPTLEDDDGDTPLDCARKVRDQEVVRLLERRGAGGTKRDLLQRQVHRAVRSARQKIPCIRYVERPWYDPHREADVRVIGGGGAVPAIEAEDLETLADINRQEDLKRFETTLLQWHPVVEVGGARGFYWFDHEAARAVGEAAKGGITRRLMLLVTTFGPGALTALAETVGGGQLRTLGLLWVFSGDDVTDRPQVVDELGGVCRMLQLKHLVILTGAYDEATDARLAVQLSQVPTLERCEVFLKDDTQLYPAIPTPAITAALTAGG